VSNTDPVKIRDALDEAPADPSDLSIKLVRFERGDGIHFWENGPRRQ